MPTDQQPTPQPDQTWIGKRVRTSGHPSQSSGIYILRALNLGGQTAYIGLPGYKDHLQPVKAKNLSLVTDPPDHQKDDPAPQDQRDRPPEDPDDHLCEYCCERPGTTNSRFWDLDEEGVGGWVCDQCEQELERDHRQLMEDLHSFNRPTDQPTNRPTDQPTRRPKPND